MIHRSWLFWNPPKFLETSPRTKSNSGCNVHWKKSEPAAPTCSELQTRVAMNSKRHMIACGNKLAGGQSKQKPTRQTFLASMCYCLVERRSEVRGDSLRGRSVSL